jgi:ATP-dependent protease ClpP protease subunit
MEHSKYKTKKAIESRFLDDKDHYMTSEEALVHGIIDEVIKGKEK